MARTLGTDDGVTTCDCCGKSNLKFTVVIELNDGEIVHYGQVCAGRNTGKDRRTQTSEARAYHLEQVAAARAEWHAHPAHAAERARFAERDDLARRTGQRMVGMRAAEFVAEAVDAATAAVNAIAAKYRGVSPWEVRA